MSNYPLVKFVDSPAVGATVRLDLNDGSVSAPRRVEADFDLGVPTLEGDPDAVGQVFGFRSPRFTVQVKGTKANALAFVSALSKEMLRRTNWVMFQLNAATSPVWFKTYRAGYQPLSLERVYGNTATGGNASAGYPDVWRVEVPLVAEAFAYGARVTISTFQVVQGPTDLTGPVRGAMHTVLPAIKGDAPTPLRVTLTPSATSNRIAVNSAWLIGCVAGTSAMADPVVDIGTGDTVGNLSGTATPSTDASYFGGSYRTVTIAAATPNLLARFSLTIPASTPRGRYKLLLRARFTAGAAKTLLFRLRQTPNGSNTGESIGLTKTVTTVATDTGRDFWVDLGEVAFPMRSNPPATVAGNVYQLGVKVDIGTADGSASSVDVDSVKLIPIDGPEVTRATLISTQSPGNYPFASFAVVGNLDGDDEVGWSVLTGLGFTESALTLQGSFPIADPAAAQNVLFVMALDPGQGASSGVSYITTLNAQTAVDISYYPRFLHIGDGT